MSGNVTENSRELLVRAEAAYRRAVADPAVAAPIASALVDDARRSGATEALVVGLRAQAWSAVKLLAGARAKVLLDEAAQLARRAGLDARLGEVLVSRAAVHQELGSSRAAQHDLDRARALLGTAALAELEHQSAVLHQNAGRLGAAAAIYRRLLADTASPADVTAKAANNLGMIEAQFGNYGRAITLLHQALDRAREVGPALTAYFTEGLAWVTAHAGRLPESLELFEQAERLYELAGLPAAELHAEQADAMSDLRLLPEATAAADRAVQEFGASGAILMRAEAELRVARLALLVDDLELAASAASTAEHTLRRQGRAGWAASAAAITTEARTRAGNATAADLRRVRRAAGTLERLRLTSSAVEAHLVAAQLASLHGRAGWAVASLDRASALARAGSVLLRLKGWLAAAWAAELRGDRQLSLRHCRSGLGDLERHRAVLGSAELRVLASAHGADLGQIGLRALAQSGSPAQVFGWMERTRAAALLGVQRIQLDGADEELAVLRSLQAELRATGGSPTLVARHAALEHSLRRRTWSSSALEISSAPSTPLAEIRALLGDRVLVEYGVLDRRVIAAVVSSRRVRLVQCAEVAAVSDEVDGLYFALRLLSRPTATATAPATALALQRIVAQRLRRLGDLLINPLGFAGAGPELVIVPTDLLQRVPWSALSDGPVSVSPSASYWARALRQPAPDDADVVLVAGPDLPAAVDEVRRLGGLHQRHVVLQPPASTVSNVAAALRTAGLVHLACHGHIRADNAMFSGLRLSDGDLTVQELELRDIAPHRMILAACEAAADATYPGGEMLGFVSALLARGTAGMVASLVPVPDTAAVAMMVSLHKHIRRGDTLAVALHAARATLDRDDPHELVNWCGFTAFGAA